MSISPSSVRATSSVGTPPAIPSFATVHIGVPCSVYLVRVIVMMQFGASVLVVNPMPSYWVSHVAAALVDAQSLAVGSL